MNNDPTARRMVAEQDPDAALAAALERLESSRQGMRLVMIPPRRQRAPRPTTPAGDSGSADFWQWLPDTLRDAADHVADLLRKHPISSLAMDAVGGWWQRHPMRAAASVAGSEVAYAAGPLIRRYPVASVSIAALLGAAVIVGRPWRWSVLGGSSRPLHRRLTSWALSQVPLKAALGTLIALLADQAHQAATRPRAARAAPSGSSDASSGGNEAAAPATPSGAAESNL